MIIYHRPHSTASVGDVFLDEVSANRGNNGTFAAGDALSDQSAEQNGWVRMSTDKYGAIPAAAMPSADCKRRDATPSVFQQTANGGMQAGRFFADCKRRDAMPSVFLADCGRRDASWAVFQQTANAGMQRRAVGRLRETTVSGFLSQTLFFPGCGRERMWLR